MRKRIGELTDDLARLQNSQDRLEERLAAVEVGQASRARHASPAPEPAAAPPERPPLAVVRVTPESQPSSPSADDGASDGDDLDAALAEDDAGDGPRPVIRGVGGRFETSTTGSGAVSEAERAEYRAALGLVRAKDYEGAAAALARFASAHPKSPLAESALYFGAECRYALGDYEAATRSFRDVVQRFPKGKKAPDALLKLGMSLAKLGRADDARASFARLSQTYPDAAAARRIPEGY